MKPIERVGVLMIHGIGQQTRYGHLEPEVSEIARALNQQAAQSGLRPPVIRARSRAPKMRGATDAVWNDGKDAPIVLEFDLPERLLKLHFREVWWADLGDRTGFMSLSRFYAWALGMWLKPESRSTTLGGQVRLRFPETAPPTFWQKLVYRSYLALVGLVVFLPIPLAIVLRILRIGMPKYARLLAEYLGDVKLYQDPARAGGARIEDLELPPRTSIRARMIQAQVEMALSNYDRWYICAHSLGSVIAFNGLMETEQALPNYLDDYMIQRARTDGLLVKTTNPARALSQEERKLMCPPRPATLAPDEIIDRSRLFSRLRGLLTYGCPLERFRLLWPAIVPINKEAERGLDPPAFSNLRWVNLLDPSDPVASDLASFEPRPGSLESHPSPINVPYRCAWPQLGSHITYLRLRKGPCAARCLAQWLVSPPAEVDARALWSQVELTKRAYRAREGLEVLGWLVMLLFGLSVTAAFVLFFTTQFGSGLSWPSWLQLLPLLERIRAVVTVGVGLMLASGIVLYVWQSHLHRKRESEHRKGSGSQGGGTGPGSSPDLAARPAE